MCWRLPSIAGVAVKVAVTSAQVTGDISAAYRNSRPAPSLATTGNQAMVRPGRLISPVILIGAESQ